MEETEVAVVGAGPAGLSAAGALKKRGLSALVLDRDDSVGTSWLKRYERLHLHTIRQFSGLAHKPIPRSYPKYLSRNMYAEYLREYARSLSIDVVHNCDVVKIETKMEGAARSFTIDTTKGTWRARSVVIATGMYAKAVQPAFAGLEVYRGKTVHASVYSSGRNYMGLRVLVVGLGNTGAEIAADLVESGARSVSVSVRATPPMVPRDFLATPVQLFGIALSGVPPRIADRVGTLLARVALGDLTRYGMQRANWLPFSARRVPVIDVGFVRELKRGRIAVRPTIERFTEDGVVYSNGDVDAVDAVIFATGYRSGLEDILHMPALLDEAGYPKNPSREETTQPGLYFIGFFQTHRGVLFEIEAASRRLATTIVRDHGARLNE